MHTRYVHFFSVVLLASTCFTAALADELPRTGDYTVIYTGVNTTPIKPMPTGHNQSVIPSHVTMTAVNTAGSGFLHNMAGRCVGMTTLDNDAKTLEGHGRCVYTDAAGDQIFEKYDYPVQPQGMSLKGTGEWTGGTGKFAGVSGEIKITNARLSSMIDGIAQVSGTKVGRYSFESTTSSLK